MEIRRDLRRPTPPTHPRVRGRRLAGLVRGSFSRSVLRAPPRRGAWRGRRLPLRSVELPRFQVAAAEAGSAALWPSGPPSDFPIDLKAAGRAARLSHRNSTFCGRFILHRCTAPGITITGAGRGGPRLPARAATPSTRNCTQISSLACNFEERERGEGRAGRAPRQRYTHRPGGLHAARRCAFGKACFGAHDSASGPLGRRREHGEGLGATTMPLGRAAHYRGVRAHSRAQRTRGLVGPKCIAITSSP